MKNWKLIFVVLFVVLSQILAACGAPAATQTEAAPPATEEPAEEPTEAPAQPTTEPEPTTPPEPVDITLWANATVTEASAPPDDWIAAGVSGAAGREQFVRHFPRSTGRAMSIGAMAIDLALPPEGMRAEQIPLVPRDLVAHHQRAQPCDGRDDEYNDA